MTTAGWTIMILSVGSVCILTAYCFYKVLTIPVQDIADVRSPLDIDTGDTEDAY
jgi:hypothetical protein